MRIIGITGGIGSGKSELCRLIEERNFPVIYADEVGHDIMRKGRGVYQRVVGFFGSGILDADDEIDRKALGEIVFTDNVKLDMLNSFTRQGISDEIDARLKALEAELAVFIEVPLPIKDGFLDKCEQVWCVDTTLELRIERLMKYRGLSLREAHERIKSQPAAEEYINVADIIIENNGSTKDLEDKLNMIL